MGRKRRKPGSESAGYHYDATPKNPAPGETPVKAPKPSQAATGPAGDYAGAQADYDSAVAALPPAAQAVTESATANADRAAARAKVRRAAQERQQRLVTQYVTRAFSRKLEHKGIPSLEVGPRIEAAKEDLARERDRILSAPEIQAANRSGKVVSAKGLQQLQQRRDQAGAFKLPHGLKRSEKFGISPRGLSLTGPQSHRLAQVLGTPQGSVGRTMAKIREEEDPGGINPADLLKPAGAAVKWLTTKELPEPYHVSAKERKEPAGPKEPPTEFERQMNAIKGPHGLKHSAKLGTSPRSLRLTPAQVRHLQLIEGVPQGWQGRSMAVAESIAQAKKEPTNLDVLLTAANLAPGVGLAPDLAKVGFVGARALPGLLTKEAAEKGAAKLAARGAAAAAKVRAAPGAAVAGAGRVPGFLRNAPQLAKAAAKETPKVAKGAAKKAPGVAARGAARGGQHAYEAGSGLAVLAAADRAGVDVPGGKQARALIEGQEEALAEDPGRVLAATANLLPGLLVSTAAGPVALGKSGGRAALDASGISDYSSEQISAPLAGFVGEQKDYAKHVYDAYLTGDKEKVKEATFEEGLLPEMILGPLAGKLGRRVFDPVKTRARDFAADRRAPATGPNGEILLHDHGGPVRRGTQRRPADGEAPPVFRQSEKNAGRREEAFHAATVNDQTHIEIARRRQEIDTHARKAAGEHRPVREGLGKKGKDTLRDRPTDYIGFLARAGIDLRNPDAALKELRHYEKSFAGLGHPREYGVNPEALTARDAVRHFIEHPEELRDKHLANAVEAFRAQQNGETGFRPLGFSLRNQYLGPATMHGIPLPEERVPIAARQFTAATTREGAWDDLIGRRKRAEAIRKSARKKYDQAAAFPKESDRARKLRAEGKDLYADARSVNADAKKLHSALKPFTRPGAKLTTAAKRTHYDNALAEEFAKEVRGHLETNGLHPEPAYVPDQAAISRASADESVTGGAKPLPGGPKMNSGYVWKHGLSRQGYEHLMNEGIARQVVRNHQFADFRRFRHDRGIAFNGRHQHNGAGWARAFDQGAINRKDVTLVPTQVLNRLERATQGGDPTEFEAALAEVQSARKLSPDDAQSGTIYEAFPKAAYEEKVAQVSQSNIPKLIRDSNALASRAMLSTPSFVGMQVIAEGMQSLAEVNPVRQGQGLRAYGRLTPEQQMKLSGAAGETAKAIFSPDDLQTALGSYETKPFTDALGFFRRNVFGRSARSLVRMEAAKEVNRATGSLTRRGALTGMVVRDVDGVLTKGRRLLNLQTAIQRRLEKATKGLKGQAKYDAALAYIADNPKLLDHYQRRLHDAMGGWSNLTRTGRLPESARAAGLVFYPFLRMSVQWPLQFATNHPVRAAALGYLAAQNNWALREALHGDPSFLNYAQIPTYEAGPNGPVPGDPIDLARAAPVGGAWVQAVQGSGSLLSAVQPIPTAIFQGLTGQGPLGPVDGGVPAHLAAAGASVLSLSPYVRAIDTARGQKRSGQSELGVLADRANLALDPLGALSAKLKGPPGQQIARSLLLPVLPKDLEKVRDSAKLGRVLERLGANGSDAQSKVLSDGSQRSSREARKKVLGMQKRYDQAKGELDQLYAKYGLAGVAKREEEIYQYTHPYPGSTEDSGGIYGTKGDEGSGSIYDSAGSSTSSIYGDSEEAPPPPVPFKGNGVKLGGLDPLAALGGVAGAIGSLVGGEKAQAAVREALPGANQKAVASKATTKKGLADLHKRTLGKPSMAELMKAGKEGKLAFDEHGKITTPRTRRAQKRLDEAQREFDRRAVPEISELSSGGGSTEFAKWFSHYSGMDPRLVGGWVLSEGAGESGTTGGEAGKENWLAAGYPAHKTSFSEAPFFNGSPKRAAKATVEWMQGKIGAEYDYSASDGIRRALQEAPGKSLEQQAAILASSGWVDGNEGTLNQGYYEAILNNAKGVQARRGAGVPKAVKQRLKAARKEAKALGIPLHRREAGGVEKQGGPFAGSRHIVRQIVGTKVVGDKEYGHSSGGDHQPVAGGGSPLAYAQDINGDNPQEHEPPYDQASLNTITKNLRKLGADVPDMVLGDPVAGNWEGTVKGYRVQVLTNEGGEVSHIHVGARWEGEEAPPGTYAGGGASSGSFSAGSVVPGVPAVPPAGSGGSKEDEGKKEEKEKKRTPLERLQLVEQISAGDLSGLGIGGSETLPGPSYEQLSSLGRDLSERRRKLRSLSVG